MYFLQQADHTRDEANCIPDACHIDSPVWMRKLVNHDRNGRKIEIFQNAMRHENVWSAHKTNDTRAYATAPRSELAARAPKFPHSAPTMTGLASVTWATFH